VHLELGEVFALATSACWTVTTLSFEAAGRRVGSLAVNWIRLVLATLLLAAFTQIWRGKALPLDASAHAWGWLLLSGFAGLVVGDMLLFEALVRIGSRTSALIMALSPPMAALLGWLVLGETLRPTQIAGMAVTLSGIALAVLQRGPDGNGLRLSASFTGLLAAFGGAVGQASGLVLSKLGMGDYDAFASTQIRIFAGLAGYTVIFIIFRHWPRVRRAVRDAQAMKFIGLGSFFGPFLGVSLSLLAVHLAPTGVAATLMALTPILVLAPARVFFKEKVGLREAVAALVAVVGVSILCFG
jgi:drug/metabolite transporter (DMT)-like permease